MASSAFAEYKNAKTKFLSMGKLALSSLFVSGKFLEAEKICDEVLAVDPDDIETQDYKSDAQYFQTHPQEFDPSRVFIADENLNSSVPERRRRPPRREGLSSPKTTSSTLSNGSKSGTKIPISSQSDTNNNGLNGEDVTPDRKLQRSNSEPSKRSNVLQNIKRFEARARGDVPSTSCVPSISKQGSDAGSLAGSKPDVKPSTTVQRRGSDPVQPVGLAGSKPDVKPSTTVQRRGSDPVQPVGLATIFETSESPARPETVPGSIIIPATPSNISYPSSGSVKWNADLNIEEELRVKLDQEFFGSDLLSGAVFASSSGNILGSSHKGCRVTPAEIQSLTTRMSKRELITSSKVKVGGIEYSCLSATGHIVRARVRNLGINCSIFKSGIVIALYEEPVLPKPVGKLVQHIGEVLTNYEY